MCEKIRMGMEVECMRACMRKLAIWYTPKFIPITTHDELDLIMSTLGFLPLPPIAVATTTAWKEYSFPPASAFRRKMVSETDSLPRPRLPYPRIDGLHVHTYRAFLDAVNFYLNVDEISDLFHIRGMPLQQAHDRSQKWCRMVEGDSVYVYREGTADQSAYNSSKNEKSGSLVSGCNPVFLRNKDQDPVICIVPWKNIIVRIL